MAHNYDNLSLPSRSQLLHELEELIEIAQSSTSAIDALRQNLDKARGAAFVAVLAMYGFLALGILSVMEFEKTRLSSFEKSAIISGNMLAVILVGVTILSFIGLALAANSFYSRRKSLIVNRQLLRGELEIHSRILSIIDDQKKRVATLTGLSPVALATIEIRIMRLQRSAAEPPNVYQNSLIGNIARMINKVI